MGIRMCKKCEGLKYLGKCEECNGTGKKRTEPNVHCVYCNGTGKKICDACNGQGAVKFGY